jgi:hypothetical protein
LHGAGRKNAQFSCTWRDIAKLALKVFLQPEALASNHIRIQVVLLHLRKKEISAAATATPENTLNNAREAGLGNYVGRLAGTKLRGYYTHLWSSSKSPIDKSYEVYAVGRSIFVSSPLQRPRGQTKKKLPKKIKILNKKIITESYP